MTAPAPAAKPAEKPKLSHADAVKALKEADVKVRVPRIGKNGAFVVDSKTKQTVVDERSPTEKDIFAVNDHGSRYHVITVDGQKHAVEK